MSTLTKVVYGASALSIAAIAAVAFTPQEEEAAKQETQVLYYIETEDAGTEVKVKYIGKLVDLQIKKDKEKTKKIKICGTLQEAVKDCKKDFPDDDRCTQCDGYWCNRGKKNTPDGGACTHAKQDDCVPMQCLCGFGVCSDKKNKEDSTDHTDGGYIDIDKFKDKA